MKLPKLRQAALRMRHVFAETLLVAEFFTVSESHSGRDSRGTSPRLSNMGLTGVVPPGLLGLLRSVFRAT